MKSLVIHHDLTLHKTHDLVALLNMLSPFESAIDRSFYDEALKLNDYGVGIRYPDPDGDPTEEDVAMALAAAGFFRTFAASVLNV